MIKQKSIKQGVAIQEDTLRMERPHLHNLYYDCSIILLVIFVNLLLCLICTLNFILGIYVQEKTLYRAQYCPRFQASTGSLGKYPL